MAIIQGGVSGLLAGVAAEPALPLHVTGKPVPWGSLGHYRIAKATGTMAAALAASAQVFTWRWLHATYLCIPLGIKVQFQALTPFTAGTLTDFGFDLFKATAVSAGAGGTDIFASAASKMRTSMAASQMTTGQARIATTAALTALTTLDAHAIAASVGDTQRVNPAAGTEEARVNDPTLLYAPDIASGEHPLVLAQNEGFVIANRTVWPAAGTGIFLVEVSWAEVTAY